MDYLENYKNVITKESTAVKKFIINFLVGQKDNNVNFERAIENLSNLFYKEYLSTNLIEKHNSYFERILNDLRIHNYNYDQRDVDSFYKTLQNEVRINFLSLVENFTNNKLEDHQVFEKLTYESFVEHVLKYTIYKKTQSRIDNSIPHLTDLFKLFYEIKNYDDFSNNFLFEESEKITLLKISNIFKKHGENYIGKKANDKVSNGLSKINEIKSTFDENEKIILLNLVLFQDNKINGTDKIKLFLLIDNLTDDSIFEGEAKNSTLYKKVNAGLNHYGKKSRIRYCTNILNKIESLELKTTNDLLRAIKTKAQNS